MKHLKLFLPAWVLLALLFSPRPAMAQETSGIAEAVRGDTASSGFVATALHWYDAHMNYWAVGGLMAVESSFIPFPSEVVIPPAVYVAANPEGKSGMKIWLVVLFGTLGALLGALINYFLSRWLGRPIIYVIHALHYPRCIRVELRPCAPRMAGLSSCRPHCHRALQHPP